MTDFITSIDEFFSGLGVIGTILGAIIGSGITLWISKSRINADLKAKTRLEWIKEVRELTAKIVEEHNNYFQLICDYSERYKQSTKGIYSVIGVENKQRKVKDEFKVASRGLIASTSKNRNLYKLYFARITKRKWYHPKRYFCNNLYIDKHNDNNKMHILVDRVYNQVYNFEKYFLKYGKINPKFKDKNVISDFRNKTSNYLKKEWDKAKSNK